MIVKISVENEPKTILCLCTENRLEFFFNKCSIEELLAQKKRVIIEEVSGEEAEQAARDLREFSTGKITEHGDRPWST